MNPMKNDDLAFYDSGEGIGCALMGSMDLRVEAWMLSRPNLFPPNETRTDEEWGRLHEEELRKIERMDLSCNTLFPLCFYMRTSAAFRELLTSMRPHAMWAQTSRIIGASEMQCAPYFEKGSPVEEFFEKSRKEAMEVSAIDRSRLCLPLSFLTEYSVSLDFRSWVSFLKALRAFYPEYWDIYGKSIYRQLWPDNRSVVDIDELPFAPAFSSDDAIAFGTMEAGETYTTQMPLSIEFVQDVPVSLRTHLARHLQIRLLDQLWFMDDIRELETLRLGDMIRVGGTMPRSFFQTLVRHRSCWIAHGEMWDAIVGDGVSKTNPSDSIPCYGDGNRCPFKADNQARIEGKDPNPPCPLTVPASATMWNRRFENAPHSRFGDLWKQIIANHLAEREMFDASQG